MKWDQTYPDFTMKDRAILFSPSKYHTAHNDIPLQSMTVRMTRSCNYF